MLITPSLDRKLVAAAACAGVLALVLYLASLAPGLTWAHQGADGGDLLTAAVTNGVPHPPGYPFYMMALQGWLVLVGTLAPASDFAWRGNLFSAICGSVSVALTVIVAGHLLPTGVLRWSWAFLAGIAWAVSPLLWSQSILSEVYSLHALLVVGLGWAALVKPRQLWYVVAPVALGVAHHLTLILLLPAVLYALTVAREGGRRWLHPLLALIGAGMLGALLYLRIPLAASSGPSPVNWGYADNWEGFRWLVTGAAYQGYLVSTSLTTSISRVTTWAYVVTAQFTPIGLALGFVGLATWDRHAPQLRNFGLLWIAPVSIYAILYHTRDSEIYLLPVVWMMCIWMAVGLATVAAWLAGRTGNMAASLASLAAILLLLLAVTVRWDSIALRNDEEARRYLAQVAAVLEPDSIVISLGDRETFALWYGAWGDRSLAQAAPGLIVVNESLYQFDWYRRLQRDLYPEVAAVDGSTAHLIETHAGRRPIYFTEVLAWLEADLLEQVGPLWRYVDSR